MPSDARQGALRGGPPPGSAKGSRDPVRAAQITNALGDHFIDYNYRTHYEAAAKASEWLARQLEDLRKKVDASNRALAEFQNKNSIVNIDDNQNTVIQKVSDLNQRLTQTQADRIQLEAFVKVIDKGGADSLPQIRDNLLFQNLTQRFVDSRAQLVQAQAVYGENNANVRKLQGQVDELREQLKAERQRVTNELKTSFASARASGFRTTSSRGHCCHGPRVRSRIAMNSA